MVNLNPITENFEETINDSSTGTTQNNQVYKQPSENKIVNDSPVVFNQSPEVINNSALINNVTDKEILEAKKIKNELLAINVFAAAGIIISSLLFIFKILYGKNADINTNIDFMHILDISLFLLILKKSDIARKAIITAEVIILMFSLLFVFLSSKSSEFSITTGLIDFMPSILFSVLVICFLSSARIKRHFA